MLANFIFIYCLTSFYRVNADNRPQGTFKYDMMWPKRGSGRAYNSLGGVGTMMGNKTGLVVGYDVMSKDCRICTTAKSKGTEPPPHDCTINFHGSSKAMEPEAAANIVKEIEQKGVDVSTIIMDDDATTIARLRNVVDHEIVKWSDIGHTKKHLMDALFTLAKKHSNMNGDVISSLSRWFTHAIAQNKGNVEGFKKAVNQIVPHAFGDHDGCEEYEWCTFKEDPENFAHNSLPSGKDLSGDTLRSSLTSVFQVFINNADKIAPGGSTRDVEAFNNQIASKASKRIHYAGSGALKTRVESCVSRKNLGDNYISPVNEDLGLSPGIVSTQTAQRKDRKRKAMRELSNTRSFKRRRLFKKKQKKKSQRAKEVREGTTYKTSVALSKNERELEDDIELIPPPRVQPPKDISFDENNDMHLVFFDLETGGLAVGAGITQIAAVSADSDESFDQYVTPEKNLSAKASSVTGLTSVGGVLMHHGEPVNSLPIKQALTMFVSYLNDIGNVVLVAHNAPFDARHLIHHVHEAKMTSAFEECVIGFIDTCPYFKKKYPENESHKQEALVKSLLKKDYDAHNALGDVKALKELVLNEKVSTKDLCSFGFSYKSVVVRKEMQLLGEKNAPSMECLSTDNPESKNKRNKSFVSKQTINKIAQSGLNMRHLEVIFRRDGEKGLEEVLSEVVNGTPRVTGKPKAVAEGISSYLTKHSSK